MAINSRNRGPLRTLAALIVLILGLAGLLAAVHIKGTAQLTPKLGLDLSGGTQLILEPKIVGGQKPSEGQVLKAVDIIRNRVNSVGVSESEVTTQGGLQRLGCLLPAPLGDEHEPDQQHGQREDQQVAGSTRCSLGDKRRHQLVLHEESAGIHGTEMDAQERQHRLAYSGRV